MGSAELLLFGGLLLGAFSIYMFVSTLLKNNEDEQALVWASGDEPVKSKSPVIEFSRPLMHQFTLQHAVRIKRPKYRNKVRKKILTAGLTGELNVDEFIGLQLLWGVFLPLTITIFSFALEIGIPFWMTGLVSIIGFQFPHIYANSEKKKRYASVIVDLPFFVDLLALSTEAGLDFIGAIQRITDKAENSVLADEMRIILRDIKLGSSRTESLRGMQERLDMGEITSFISVLVDADATGASISAVLKDQSNQMRLERFVRAEKAGARASQTILIPLMLFIIPAVFIVVFGPVILQFMYGKG